jgi:hypothetical protein
MRSLLSVAIAMWLAMVAACNGSGAESSRASTYVVVACGSDAGVPCPSPPPSYAEEVVPILQAKCNNCHWGDAGPWPLTGYHAVAAWRDLVFLDVEKCTMPPADAGADALLSDVERATLLAWISCGAPNN